ncbi:MAG: universal stress protein [Cyclobacteriaceae bacterium]|nr:universal stress protein [Cyclobacteriaceae bacterium]
MYKYKRILVGLDLTEIDEAVIKYVNFLCVIFEVDKVYFFHVAKSFELPSGIIEKYPDLIAPVDETIKKQVKSVIETHFNCNVEYSIEVKEGNPTDQILRWTNFKDIDLAVVGKKERLNGEGVLSGELVKTSHCSILFVPESAHPSIQKIMIPIDFSKTGKMTLEVGGKLQKKFNCNLLFQHCYHVPTGYHTSGKSYEEFAELMREHAQNDLEKFIEPSELIPNLTQTNLFLDEDHDPAKHIRNISKTEQVDFIIIGSKGRSEIASILVGSVAEKISKLEKQIPVLVVKNKQQNMGFLDALLKL